MSLDAPAIVGAAFEVLGIKLREDGVWPVGGAVSALCPGDVLYDGARGMEVVVGEVEFFLVECEDEFHLDAVC